MQFGFKSNHSINTTNCNLLLYKVKNGHKDIRDVVGSVFLDLKKVCSKTQALTSVLLQLDGT